MKPTRPFICTYYHAGRWWSLTIHAFDLADAKARACKLGRLSVKGELRMTLPVVPGAGWLVRFLCWVKNCSQ
jgi:hypothetical protein